MFQKNGTALYEQLVNKIEQEISSGKLAPGDRLPSENTLAEDNGISRVTVRQALKLLSEMGLIETQKGIGTISIRPRQTAKPGISVSASRKTSGRPSAPRS